MIGWLYHVLVDPLAPVAHQHALIGGSLIAVVCGVIGCFIVLRRMAFLTDALSHSMLAGVVSAYLFLRLVMRTDDVNGPPWTTRCPTAANPERCSGVRSATKRSTALA